MGGTLNLKNNKEKGASISNKTTFPQGAKGVEEVGTKVVGGINGTTLTKISTITRVINIGIKLVGTILMIASLTRVGNNLVVTK